MTRELVVAVVKVNMMISNQMDRRDFNNVQGVLQVVMMAGHRLSLDKPGTVSCWLRGNIASEMVLGEMHWPRWELATSPLGGQQITRGKESSKGSVGVGVGELIGQESEMICNLQCLG